jgi:glycosyltransferase involved in cell wall biosynthesis
MKKFHICFIAKSIHYVLLGNTEKLIGGAEVQQYYLSKNLAKKGWKVSFITEIIDTKKKIHLNNNIDIYHAIYFKKGNKLHRKFVTIPNSLWASLKEVNADIIYQRNPDFLSGIIAIFSKLNNKKFILAGANNWNFDKGKEKNFNNIIDQYSSRIGIRLANDIIIQNKEQQTLLKRNYNKSGSLFHNIYPKKKMRCDHNHILWVARMEFYKNPELYLELARSLPEYNFVMVGGKAENNKLSDEIVRAARKINNLEYLGHQPFERVEMLFDAAALFVNTSIPDCEGFPNTFLQAWGRGIPVISFHDPDGLISRYNLGKAVSSMAQMKDGIISLIAQQKKDLRLSKEIQKIFLDKFEEKGRIDQFIKILTG